MKRPLPKIILRPLHMDHIGHVMEWVNDPEVMGYFAGCQNRISFDEERMYMESLINSNKDSVSSAFDAETGEYVGQCSINQIHWPSENGRVFLVVTKKQQGKGYAEAMLAKLIEIARDSIRLHKLWLIVREDNDKSLARFVRAGFRIEGVLRDEYLVGGKYHNMIRMGMIL